MLRRMRPFGRDQRGVSAVEFALIAPVMILIYVGLVELCQGLLAERRASHAASSVGDLITQDQSVTATELQDIFAIGNSVMAPLNPATLKICSASISVDPSTGGLKVNWNASSTAAGTMTRDCSSVPADFPQQTVNGVSKPFINAGESIILTRAEYTYTSIFTGSTFLTGPIVFKEAFYLRPRKSTCVAYVNGTTTLSC
jgi:Flp pilus assembly protein TadG